MKGLKKKTAAVVVFPGTNCDTDTKEALEYMGFKTSYISYSDTNLDMYDTVFLPGGFSYGDYIRSGRLAKLAPVMDAIRNYVKNKRGLVAGICNGFQILCEAGLLPGALTDNISAKFVSKVQKLIMYQDFSKSKILNLPIAHKEGRYYADDDTLLYLKKNNMIFLKYENTNPNGSVYDIAGIYDKNNKIMGLMPHPERAVFSQTGLTDGRYIFEMIYNEIL